MCRACFVVGQAAEKYIRAKFREDELSEELNKVINNVYEAAIRLRRGLLAGRLARRPYVPLRLPGRGRPQGADRRSEDQPLRRRGDRHPGPGGSARIQARRRPEKGRARPRSTPGWPPPRCLLADLNISDERFLDARDNARKAVAENPRDEDALARLAAAARLLVDPLGAQAVESVALASNPRPATFYAALAERLADRRKYHSAERAFLQSIAADDNRPDTRIGLGMLYMQIGREAEARDLFEAAFAADPFNVRAKNMRLILKHMEAYRPTETEHYTVLADPAQDSVLARYMAKYLESIHVELVKSFGYEPPGLTQIEIMKDHEKFSGRTVALPFIPTVGPAPAR